MIDIIIKKKNEIYADILNSDIAFRKQLSDILSYKSDDAKFSIAYKRGYWDGMIHLYKASSCSIHLGLIKTLYENRNNLDCKISYENFATPSNTDKDFVEKWIDSFENDKKFKARSYQRDAVVNCILTEKAIALSPTASGKTYTAFLLTNFLLSNNLVKRVLYVVPTIMLVKQMKDDFQKYMLAKMDIHTITANSDKTVDAQIVCSTWQSLATIKDDRWFEKFDLIIVDEVHGADAKSLKTTIEKCVNSKYRFGFTGSLKDAKTNIVVLEALFVKYIQVVKIKDLIDRQEVAEPKIKILVLKHNKQDSLRLKNEVYKIDQRGNKIYDFNVEMLTLANHKKRNELIYEICENASGNVLVLFSRVATHGKVLYSESIKRFMDRNVCYISGEINLEERAKVVHTLENNDNVIAYCSFQTFGTGVSVNNIKHIIFASPYKSRTKVLQAIGRGMRLKKNSKTFNVYDIADDFRIDNFKNLSLVQFYKRIALYKEQQFDYKVIKYNI